MEKTLVLIVTHRGVSYDTEKCLRSLVLNGCSSRVDLLGLSNLAKARSQAFDQALALTEGTPIDTVLCIDDDMVFEPEQARAVVELSRRKGELVSGICMSSGGVLCARPGAVQGADGATRWLTGFGFLAVPRSELVRVAPALPVLGGLRVWCQTGEHPHFPGEWIGEDLWFSSHFGGALMAPLPIGHLKTQELRPNAEQVRAVMGYVPEPPS
jgi:hypothetical protein